MSVCRLLLVSSSPPLKERRQMPVKRRRFPPPWDIEEHNASCFIVMDANRFPVHAQDKRIANAAHVRYRGSITSASARENQNECRALCRRTSPLQGGRSGGQCFSPP